MIAVFTGTRGEGFPYPEGKVLCRLAREHGAELTVFVGDCKTGVDREVREVCKDLGIDFAVFHANWNYYSKKAGPQRNVCMLQIAMACQTAGATVEVWYRASSGRSPGTRGCVRIARKLGLDCHRVGGMGPEL